MQTHLLLGKGKEIWLVYPENWDELTAKQSKYAGKLLRLLSQQKLEIDQFRKLMVDKFINRNNRGMDKMKSIDDSMDMWGNESQLADTVNFFFKITEKDDKEQYEIMPTGVKNHFPIMWHRGQKYIGPGDFLAGMTFAQFKDALSCCYKYMESRDDYWLTRVAATLYKRKGENYNMDDVGLVFNS